MIQGGMKEFFEGNFELPQIIKAQKSGRQLPPRVPVHNSSSLSKQLVNSLERENAIKTIQAMKNKKNHNILRKAALENLVVLNNNLTNQSSLQKFQDASPKERRKHAINLKQSIQNSLQNQQDSVNFGKWSKIQQSNNSFTGAGGGNGKSSSSVNKRETSNDLSDQVIRGGIPAEPLPKKDFDMDVVNEYLYRKQAKKNSNNENKSASRENANRVQEQINSYLNGKLKPNLQQQQAPSSQLRNHHHRTDTDTNVYFNQNKFSPQNSQSPQPFNEGIPQTKLPLINSTRQIFESNFLNAQKNSQMQLKNQAQQEERMDFFWKLRRATRSIAQKNQQSESNFNLQL